MKTQQTLSRIFAICDQVAATNQPIRTESQGKKALAASLGAQTPNVKTQNIRPPIPVRSFDWIAWIDGLEECGPHGAGETEAEAKTDLQFQIECRMP